MVPVSESNWRLIKTVLEEFDLHYGGSAGGREVDGRTFHPRTDPLPDKLRESLLKLHAAITGPQWPPAAVSQVDCLVDSGGESPGVAGHSSNAGGLLPSGSGLDTPLAVNAAGCELLAPSTEHSGSQTAVATHDVCPACGRHQPELRREGQTGQLGQIVCGYCGTYIREFDAY